MNYKSLPWKELKLPQYEGREITVCVHNNNGAKITVAPAGDSVKMFAALTKHGTLLWYTLGVIPVAQLPLISLIHSRIESFIAEHTVDRDPHADLTS
jgi:hypothetical protein